MGTQPVTADTLVTTHEALTLALDWLEYVEHCGGIMPRRRRVENLERLRQVIALARRALSEAVGWRTMALSLWGNGVDYVIAETAEEAQQVFAEPYGSDAPERDQPFTRVPDDKVIGLTYEDEPEVGTERKTAAEWVRDSPFKMLLASSELYD